ncbi:MAG: hypothetical protein A3I61_08365 [Acidobacteria bacterium RIFCSPLOWO2_02_FULL_68_18]|nr:MAG: hypothetical protein A3I61_08365 [Acidobacteria bacterium RIFCSPLOWO2_02_FULL_68_18]OFW48864.1 MAG: hypothetical protein A3G77_01485 [Acidobacteria bacterium RIFCSPLOWO2_12_FULL_68_19]
MTMFGRKTRVLILDDRGPVLERLQSRFDVFWPPEIPVKTLAMYCAWGNEAIEAIKEIQPDILVLNHVFRKDEGAAREVTQWIDQKYPAPLIVAVHSDEPEDDVRRFFAGAACVKFFICGERVRDFIEYCLSKRTADGIYVDR